MENDVIDNLSLGGGRVGNVAVERLQGIVSRIERLLEEKKALGGDIKDIFAESKSAGFDNKVLRKLLKLRKQDPDEVEQEDLLLETYRKALEG